MPVTVVQSLHCVGEVRLADDVVSLEDRPRLVSGHLHRHALRDGSPNKIPDGGPAEVMRDSPWATGLCASCLSTLW